MASKKEPICAPEYGCAVEVTSDIIGGKWKSVILYHLLEQSHRFGQLHRLIPPITQRMLTQQLRDLEADGLVHRKVYREIPPRVEYSLTPLGQSLKPIIIHMHKWGTQYAIATNKDGMRKVLRAPSTV